MRDENYYREKQVRIDKRNTVGAIHKSHIIIKNAMARLALFFKQPTIKRYRRHPISKVILINHKRPLKQRLVRRYKHSCRMRNAA